jgi:hypothetical protein
VQRLNGFVGAGIRDVIELLVGEDGPVAKFCTVRGRLPRAGGEERNEQK